MKRRSFILGATVALGVPQILRAQAAPYPGRPVRMVIPFAPGQGSDILARAIGQRLHAIWKQPVIVENRAGANGTIAVNEIVKSDGDGHTLLLTSNSPIVINPNLYQDLSYDVQRDLKPVLLMSTTPVGLMVNPKLPAGNIDELIALLKAEPGKYSYGSIGVGSTSHLAMETFKRATGVDAVHVPYRGSSLAMNDLISGTIQLMFDGLPSSLPLVKAGRIRSIAVSGSRPTGFLPAAPALGAIGIEGTPDGGWYGVLASSKVDDAIIQKLNEDLNTILREPDIKAQLTTLAMEPVPAMSSGQFGDFIRKQTGYWRDLTQSLGLYRTA